MHVAPLILRLEINTQEGLQIVTFKDLGHEPVFRLATVEFKVIFCERNFFVIFFEGFVIWFGVEHWEEI